MKHLDHWLWLCGMAQKIGLFLREMFCELEGKFELAHLLSSLGSGPRYQILSHVFARCASQKTHGHARIARVSRASVQLSHVRVFSDSRNVQKSVTQIIYLWPLPRAPSSSPGVFHLVVGRSSGQGWSMLHKPCQLLARESKKSHTCYIFARVQRSNLSTFPFQNVKRRDKREAASALCKSSTV